MRWSQDSALGGHRIHVSSQLGHLPGTGGGPRTPKGMGGTPSDWLRDLGSQAGGKAQALEVGAPSPNCWTNREPQTPGNINRSEASQRSSSQHKDPALPDRLQTPLLDISGQTTSKTGIQTTQQKNKK